MKDLIKRFFAFLGSIVIIFMTVSLTMILYIYKFVTKGILRRGQKQPELAIAGGAIESVEGEFDTDDPFGAPQVKRGAAKKAMKTSQLTVDDVKGT